MFSSTLLWCIVRAGAVNCVCIPLLLAFFFSLLSLFSLLFLQFSMWHFWGRARDQARTVCAALNILLSVCEATRNVCQYVSDISRLYLFIFHQFHWFYMSVIGLCVPCSLQTCMHTCIYHQNTHGALFFVSHLSNRDALEFVAAAALIVLYSHMFGATNTILFFSSLIQKRLHKTHCARAVLKSRNCLCLAISCLYVQCTEMNKFDGQTGVYESTDVSQMYNGFAIVCALSRRRFFSLIDKSSVLSF